LVSGWLRLFTADGGWLRPIHAQVKQRVAEIVDRAEREHPRITAFLTGTGRGVIPGQIAGLELRHRKHARVEDRLLLRGSPGCRATWRWSVLRRAFATHLAGAALVIVADQKPSPRGPATCATPRVVAASS
jgi:hypothetical protein